MLKADQCREKAEEAEAMAKLVSLETDRQRLRDMAEAWRERAREAEAEEQVQAKAERPRPGWFARR